jgi:2-polyprenyl-3-methyl-5-hydroxy-6-metoxy-1,4-benzoquinol methylase
MKNVLSIIEKHTQCLLCNSKDLIPLINYYEKLGLIKCRNCSFIFMEQIPTTNELNAYYETYAYDGQESLSPITIESYNKLLDEFESYRQTNKLLDVGCGRGGFLMEAKKRGWDVYGTEYSSTAIKLCEEKGIIMKEGVLDGKFFPFNDFDIITSFEVIEHINNPKEEVSTIHSLMRKGGLFYCTTPNFNSLMRYYLKTNYNVITYPEHLSYYTKRTLDKLMNEQGFLLKRFLTTGISVSRIQASLNKNTVLIENTDEKLRNQISKHWYLKGAKFFINRFLSFTKTGLTLKGYYIKK